MQFGNLGQTSVERFPKEFYIGPASLVMGQLPSSAEVEAALESSQTGSQATQGAKGKGRMRQDDNCSAWVRWKRNAKRAFKAGLEVPFPYYRSKEWMSSPFMKYRRLEEAYTVHQEVLRKLRESDSPFATLIDY